MRARHMASASCTDQDNQVSKRSASSTEPARAGRQQGTMYTEATPGEGHRPRTTRAIGTGGVCLPLPWCQWSRSWLSSGHGCVNAQDFWNWVAPTGTSLARTPVNGGRGFKEFGEIRESHTRLLQIHTITGPKAGNIGRFARSGIIEFSSLAVRQLKDLQNCSVEVGPRTFYSYSDTFMHSKASNARRLARGCYARIT